MLLWQSIIKINCYVMNLTYIKWNLIEWTANCFTVIVAAVYIKMIRIIETLHCSGKCGKERTKIEKLEFQYLTHIQI